MEYSVESASVGISPTSKQTRKASSPSRSSPSGVLGFDQTDRAAFLNLLTDACCIAQETVLTRARTQLNLTRRAVQLGIAEVSYPRWRASVTATYLPRCRGLVYHPLSHRHFMFPMVFSTFPTDEKPHPLAEAAVHINEL